MSGLEKSLFQLKVRLSHSSGWSAFCKMDFQDVHLPKFLITYPFLRSRSHLHISLSFPLCPNEETKDTKDLQIRELPIQKNDRSVDLERK